MILLIIFYKECPWKPIRLLQVHAIDGRIRKLPAEGSASGANRSAQTTPPVYAIPSRSRYNAVMAAMASHDEAKFETAFIADGLAGPDPLSLIRPA
jgi:hypothetical protein